MSNGVFFDIKQKYDDAPEFWWYFLHSTQFLRDIDISTYGNWEFYPPSVDMFLDYDGIEEILLNPLKEIYLNKKGSARIADMYSGVDLVTGIGEFARGNHVKFYVDPMQSPQGEEVLKMDICLVDDFDENLLSDTHLHLICIM